MVFVQFGVGVSMVINLPYITEELSGSYAMYGYFMAGFPLGYVLGTILAGRITYRSRRVLMLGALMVGGLTFISLGLTNSIVLAIMTETVAGIAMAFFGIHNITLCQQLVPNGLMGKVSSVRLFLIRCSMPLGIALGSALSETWGIRPLYLLIGCIICTVSVLAMTFHYFAFIDHEPTEESGGS